MINKTQILKGILEGCILSLLSVEKMYSQEIAARLEEDEITGVSDGTLFPLLLRLENEGLIVSEKVPVSNGPCRKYYTLSAAGSEELLKFSAICTELFSAVKKIIEGGKENGEA